MWTDEDFWDADDDPETQPDDPDDLYEIDGWDKHADSRDKRREHDRRGMQVTNRSMKTVILPMIGKRAGGKNAR